MTDTNKTLRLALQRALIELEYAHDRLGNDRRFTRGDTIEAAKLALREPADPDYKAIAMAAGFRLNIGDDGGVWWYTPGFDIDDPEYREGNVVIGEDKAWRDCCVRNNLLATTTLADTVVRWRRLRDVPTVTDEDGVDRLDADFETFPKGTNIEDVWHAFEADCPEFSIGRAMEGAYEKVVG